MNLVIIESPAKGKTIEKFLGQDYKVLASYGHIRDLPKSKLGIDVENDFEPQYLIPLKSRKNVKLLKEAISKMKDTEEIILATDPDREGESIAWHIVKALDLQGKDYKRISFQEITKKAVEYALKNPRKIDIDLVNAQQARRVLDRIVGYTLSPFLWKKVARRLSAGRVQSVVVRLIAEREKEIEKFTPEEYWSIEACLQQKNTEKEFTAILVKKDNKALDKLAIKNKKQAKEIITDLKQAEYRIENINKKEVKRNPLPSFTTSTLQQEAWQKFKFSAKFTMGLAQQLYEAGQITYHRTDSLNVSDSALASAEKFIIKEYGKEYWPGFSRKYKTKKKAQEAHEAIRPTNPIKTPEKQSKLNVHQLKLYSLIWKRFIASQMQQAIFDATTIDISAKNYNFKANGQILKFDGFLKVYPVKFKENELPDLKEKEVLGLLKLIPNQHFTQPPARYNEASLIKELEENGIGRPSTYAPIISTIQERNYVEKNQDRKFQPTEIGIIVNDILVNHFPEIVDIEFTAKMEENLDKIAEKKKKWISVVKDFYFPFEKNLKQKYNEVTKKELTKVVEGKKCPKCGSDVLIRFGKFGKFYACSNFPECKYTESLKDNSLKTKCPKCQKGDIVEKRTRKKKVFYGCSNWPDCNFALWDKPVITEIETDNKKINIIEKCPECESVLVETKKGQVKCSNKDCQYKLK